MQLLERESFVNELDRMLREALAGQGRVHFAEDAGGFA